jgi:hypothetical protein
MQCNSISLSATKKRNATAFHLAPWGSYTTPLLTTCVVFVYIEDNIILTNKKLQRER